MRLLMCVLFIGTLASGSPILRESEINEVKGLNLYEGDIILDSDERPVNGTLKYTAIIGKRWPNPVPFEFGPDMKHKSSGKKAIMAAIEQYHKYTCIRFKPRTTEKGYMRFDWAPGCASAVGFKPMKANKINLDSPCWHLGTIMHEMGHALGLWHEQSRPDRNKYIKIMWNNIAAQQDHNFLLHKDSDDLGTYYDLGSMMHYGTTEFSSSGSRTIRTLDYSKRLLIGQRAGFSDKDVQVLNLMYNCPAYKGTVPPKVCRDVSTSECAREKKKGRCKNVSYETRMYRNCCKTCFGNIAGKLGEPKTWPSGSEGRTTPAPEPTKVGPCVDTASKTQCDYWARMKYCTSSSSVIRRMTQTQCCASCKAHSHHLESQVPDLKYNR